MKIEGELRERLLTASREELEALRLERPELSELIDDLLGTEEALGAWLGSARDISADAVEAQPVAVSDENVVALPWRPPRAGILAAASVAALLGSAFLVRAAWLNSAIDVENDGMAAAGSTLIQHDLEVEADSDYLVFPTGDPNIAVVWLMNGD